MSRYEDQYGVSDKTVEWVLSAGAERIEETKEIFISIDLMNRLRNFLSGNVTNDGSPILGMILDYAPEAYKQGDGILLRNSEFLDRLKKTLLHEVGIELQSLAHSFLKLMPQS